MKKKKKEERKYTLLKILLSIIILAAVGYYFVTEYELLDKFNINLSKPVQLVIPKLKIIDEDSNSRVIAVTINNSHKAWPHSGLQDAFLNYELIAEGGITRILSFFKDKDTERIGSVRSARHYFLDYVMENDAIYVHFGFSPQAKSDISTLKIDNLNGLYLSRLCWRDKTLKKASEHTAFTSMKKINDLIKSKKIRSTTESDPLLNYTTKKVRLSSKPNAIKADTVYINYSSYTSTSFEYDASTGLYKRSMDGQAHTDYVTKKQYTTKNIITYQVKNSLIGSKGRQTLSNIGTGKGYYITNGYAVPITWEKESRASQTIYKYEDGTEIDVNDGVTWIQVQPLGKKITIKAKEEISSTN